MPRAAWAAFAVLVIGTGAAGAAPESAVLTGTARDGNGDGLPGVRVQIFLDGHPLACARSDSLGGYRVAFPWHDEADSTVVAWWTAEGSDLVPAVAVLRESRAARRLGLWDRSLPRIAVPAESVHHAVLPARGAGAPRETAPDTTGTVPGAGGDTQLPPARPPEALPDAGPGNRPGTDGGPECRPSIEPAR